jgi:predicted glutamine amidotransferase
VRRRSTTEVTDISGRLACAGSSALLEKLLSVPVHSLIDQSLHSRPGATTTNGDGFGVGSYAARAQAVASAS